MFEVEQILDNCRSLLSISQIGIHYSKSLFEKQRYEEVQKIAVNLLNHYSSYEIPIEKLNLESLTGYCTPQVTVRGVVLCKNKKIIIVKEKGKNVWNLPGGYAEVNDSPADAIKREVFEETGLKANPHKILAVYQSKKKQVFTQYAIYFLCALESTSSSYGCLDASEIEAIKYVDINLVEEYLLNKYFQEQWPKIKRLILSPTSLTDFD